MADICAWRMAIAVSRSGLSRAHSRWHADHASASKQPCWPSRAIRARTMICSCPCARGRKRRCGAGRDCGVSAAAGAAPDRSSQEGRVMARLDNRECLYGEPRLSDAQVRCLRHADRASLHHVRSGWGDISENHRQGTVTALVNMHLLCVEPNRASVRITQRGQERLAAIAAAAAYPAWPGATLHDPPRLHSRSRGAAVRHRRIGHLLHGLSALEHGRRRGRHLRRPCALRGARLLCLAAGFRRAVSTICDAGCFWRTSHSDDHDITAEGLDMGDIS